MMTRQPNTKRAALIRAGLVASIIILVGGKWYVYVAHADSPFDQVGSGINSIMPGPINRLGCEMLKKRFGDIPIPPRGCNIDGRWA